MRTKEEIAAEIVALEDCLTFAPQKNMFGDDNHKDIRIQLQVLKGDVNPDSDDVWEPDISESERDAAFAAGYWAAGDENEAPSAGWQAFRRKN